MTTSIAKFTILSALSLLLIAPAAQAGNVKEIVKKANLKAYYQGKDGRAKVRMTIVDNKGRKRYRQFTMLRRNIKPGGDQNFLVLFTRPADVRRTVFMVSKHINRDDDRWMYLPALDLVKRIASSDKRTSFVGSHFFYEDISGRSLDEDRHKLLKSTDTHYVVRATPKKRGGVEFKHFDIWVDKKTMIPSKMEYVDKSGKPYRRIEALEIKTKGGYATVTKMKATDLASGGYTISEMRGIKYDLNVPQDVFAERSLRNPPRKWLK